MQFENIPQELKDLNQWVLWRIEKVKGDIKKVPYQINGEKGGYTDPQKGASFDKVLALFDDREGFFDGIGFAFTEQDPYVGIDLDKVIDEKGEISEEALEVLNSINSYTEYSPSKRGFHIIAKGKLPEEGSRRGFLEMYDKLRYFTMTGNVYRPIEIKEQQEGINHIHDKYIKKQTKEETAPINSPPVTYAELPDDKLLEIAKKERGGKFNDLWNGNLLGYDSQSEADQALCNKLAFYTMRNAMQMDRLFRQSALFREKWDEVHKPPDTTYGQMTIKKAINDCREIYTLPKKTEKIEKKKLQLVSMEDTKLTKADFLLYPYIPKGKLTAVVADPGVGKTWFVLYLISAFSNGIVGDKPNTLFFGERISPIKTWFQSAEDGYSDTIKPRLQKMGANEKNILYAEYSPELRFSNKELPRLIEEYDIKLLVFDPIQAFIGGKVDVNKMNDVRESLNPLVEIAEKYDCAVVLIMHQNKMANQKSLYRVMGSMDFVGAVRSIITILNDPTDREKKLVFHIKSNLAKTGETFSYHIDDEKGVVFDGFLPIRIEDIENPKNQGREKTSPKLDEAVEFLRETLSDKPMEKAEVMKQMYEKGCSFSDRTLQTAREILGVEVEVTKTFPAKSIWSIPQGGDMQFPDNI